MQEPGKVISSCSLGKQEGTNVIKEMRQENATSET